MIENLTNNYTISKIAFDIDNASFYNTGCINELNKQAKLMENFKVDIINTINQRFKIALIILIILLFYKIYIEYHKPLFSQTEFYQKYVAYRIDFIILIIAIITIALLYI